MTIKKFITLAILTCLPLTVSADFFQDQKDKAEADFDLEFGGCEAKIAKQKSQIEQLQIHLEGSKNDQAGNLQTIAMLQNQLALQSNGVNSQLTEANQQVQAYSNALNDQKILNNRLVSQINILKLKLANNSVVPVIQSAQTTVPDLTRVLDSSIDIVESWDDALWNWTANSTKNRRGQDFEYICKKNGAVARITGVDYYTTSSSVCTAAAHAGIISVKKGGRVIFRIGGKKNTFKSGYRNDITSRSSSRSETSHFTFPVQ